MRGSTVATRHPLQPPHTRPLSPFHLLVGVRDMCLLLTLGSRGYHGCAIFEGKEEVKGRRETREGGRGGKRQEKFKEGKDGRRGRKESG